MDLSENVVLCVIDVKLSHQIKHLPEDLHARGLRNARPDQTSERNAHHHAAALVFSVE